MRYGVKLGQLLKPQVFSVLKRKFWGFLEKTALAIGFCTWMGIFGVGKLVLHTSWSMNILVLMVHNYIIWIFYGFKSSATDADHIGIDDRLQSGAVLVVEWPKKY
ncbi:MAG: hypothetical protein CM1200mP6_09810 [Anaerolineaceae bacterium]|nr:MAG: hypothetical protein CM1200mP6_09810 [Anaerolineaceae bacterium]